MKTKTGTAILLALLFSLATIPAAAQLDISDNQVWAQGLNGVPDHEENNDAFGQDVAIGDFDGDGIGDLAVSSPGEDDAKGVVHVIYGADSGLSSVGVQEWRQGGNLGGDDEDGDLFGFALATGDFNGDGFDDLAISAPGEDGARGNVQIIHGSANGLTAQGTQIWDQDRGLEGSGRERDDSFGFDITTGDFNGDGFDDLAVGTPFESNGGGLVNVIYGSSNSLTTAGNQRWRQGADNISGGREDGDVFGYALAAGDTDGDGYDDLIVGAPGEDSAKGQFHVIFGAASGLISNGNQRWQQDNDGLPEDREDGDTFGDVLATGDFNNDGYADVVASALGESNGEGVVILVPGSPSGPDGNRSQRWRQGESGPTEIPEDRENGDRFGSSLAVGDFDRDSFDDLAIGSRGEDGNRGIVQVVYGSMAGLTLDGWQRFIQGLDGLQGQALTGESFGFAMAAGDIGFDFADDLVISAPGEQGGNARGVVHAIYGIASGAPTISGIVGAGNSVPEVNTLAYNSLVTIYGFNLFPEGKSRVITPGDLLGGRLPTVVDDVCVEMNGRRTPIIYIDPVQINFQAHTMPGENSAQVEVVLNCGLGNEFRSAPVSVDIAPAAPEFFFFVLNANGRNPVAAVNNTTGEFLGRPNLRPDASFTPARPGDIVLVFVTGLGETSPRFDPGELPAVAGESLRLVELWLGGVPVPVIYAGVTPGFAGLYQIAFEVPANASAGDLQILVKSISGDSIIESPPGAYLTVER